MTQQWNAEKETIKALARQVAPCSAPATYAGLYHHFNSDDEITVEDIQEAILKSAHLIHELEIDVEIFEFLKKSLDRKKVKQSTLDEIKQLINSPVLPTIKLKSVWSNSA